MSSNNWNEIETLFEAALDRPPESRFKWLRSVCTDEDTLREVSSMLRAADLAEDFLTKPASQMASTLIIDAQAAERSQHSKEWTPASGEIGRYRIVERIGWGGAGAVYLAERSDGQFEQKVAIKLLREDKISRLQNQRFLAERQILASLDHPGIARLLDGGVTEEGMPFIVMEYVNGSPIDAYCDQKKLSVRSRLILFRQVCVAVQHAHSRLIVHRDIKPSNVMVTEDGRVKLVDFGIAKLVDPALDGPETGRPTLRLTPEYASPEQVRGEPVTAVSDVYSLGVLLYELLCGRRPYDLVAGSPADIVRMVCEHEPMPPSMRLRETTVSDNDEDALLPQDIAGRRNTSIDALARLLGGDIDTIVMKALRKEPGRRYQSVDSFADDVSRYLETRPVSARADSMIYRISRYVRRNRVIVSAAVLVIVALVGGLAASLWQSSKRAEQAQRAERTTRFMRDMLGGFNPNARPEGVEHVEQILDVGAERLHRDLSREPRLSAEIAGVLGDLYEDYGLYEKARDLFELSIAQLRSAGGENDTRIADNTFKLAWVLTKMGDLSSAKPMMVSALELTRRAYGDQSSRVGEVLDGLAVVHLNLSELDEAERLLKDALRILRLQHGEGDVRVASVHRHLAYVNQYLYRFAAADSLYVLAREAMVVALGPDHTDVAQTIHDHGSLLVRIRRASEAEDNFRRALRIRRQRFGNQHPQVAQSLSHLGLMLSDRGRYDEAESMLNEALEIRRAVFGEKHLTYAHTINQLGQLYHARGDQTASDSLLLAAIQMYRELLGENNLQTVAAMQIWGRRLQERGANDEAASVFREVLLIRRQLIGENTLPTTETMLKLGTALLAVGEVDEASALLREATDIRTRLYGPKEERTIEVRLEYGKSLMALGRYEDAELTLAGILGAFAEDSTLSVDLQRRVREALSHLYGSWNKATS